MEQVKIELMDAPVYPPESPCWNITYKDFLEYYIKYRPNCIETYKFFTIPFGKFISFQDFEPFWKALKQDKITLIGLHDIMRLLYDKTI